MSGGEIVDPSSYKVCKYVFVYMIVYVRASEIFTGCQSA